MGVNNELESVPEASNIVRFKLLEIGQIILLPLSIISPSQPDDGEMPVSSEPIEVYYDDGKVIVLHGNHRYYSALKLQGSEGVMQVRKISHPAYY